MVWSFYLTLLVWKAVFLKLNNSKLLAPFSSDECKLAISQMQPDKSLGPDGLNLGFYQKIWHVIGQDVFNSCCDWLNRCEFPNGLNDTVICLIPKCDSPSDMRDPRPISLCNVLYKILARVLANRIKNILPKVISEAQSAFVLGRFITDNVISAFELLHYMKRKTRGNKGVIALKIDISKAYDRMSWSHLKAIMQKLGFASRWIDWIMLCVSSVQYSVAMNGARGGTYCSQEGS